MSTPTRSRRISRVPGFFTRAQVEQDLGLSADQLDTLERQGALGPSQRREAGDTRPVLYTAVDLALARITVRAWRFGVRGEPLRALAARAGTKRKRLVPGWRGFLVVEADGDVDLVPASGLDAYAAGFSSPPSLLAVWVEMPPATPLLPEILTA